MENQSAAAAEAAVTVETSHLTAKLHWSDYPGLIENETDRRRAVPAAAVPAAAAVDVAVAAVAVAAAAIAVSAPANPGANATTFPPA